MTCAGEQEAGEVNPVKRELGQISIKLENAEMEF